MTRTVVDVAGARVGGAKRFLDELDLFLQDEPTEGITVVGRDRALTPAWLVRREWHARGAASKIAINNASFSGPGGTRVVSLRNALHFASEQEFRALNFTPSAELRLQIPMIRALATRADLVEVPCTAMAERVLRHAPGLRSRLEVRFHPVSPRPWAFSAVPTSPTVLVPIVNSPYKLLDERIGALLDAARSVPQLEGITVTADAGEFCARVANDPLVRFVGRLSAEDLDAHWARSRAVYYPTSVESFGYPLAEARANGRRVVALATAQSTEIAGSALAGFTTQSPGTLAEALHEALTVAVAPDPVPFDRATYFHEFLRP